MLDSSMAGRRGNTVAPTKKATLLHDSGAWPDPLPQHLIWQGKVEDFLAALPREPLFDLVVTSPPYNIGKDYESKTNLNEYLQWQTRIIDQLLPRLKPA